jgi:hypothetical protein
MTRRWLSRKAGLTALLVVGAVGTAAFLWAKWGGHRGDATPSAERAIFLERASEAGLDFRMAFLPGEQGETFKINLYDHGCGVAVGDYDGDGHDDVFFCNQLGPCALFRNKGDGTFEDVTHKAGMACPRSSRSAACADFDGDGRLDLVANNFNDRPCYFRNRLPPRNYLALRLQGTRSNRDAIGAVVRLYAGKEVMTRQVSPASGYLAQSSKTVHFGLGDRAQIDRVEIVWPSGTVQTLDRPAINVLHPLTEGEKKDAPRH